MTEIENTLDSLRATLKKYEIRNHQAMLVFINTGLKIHISPW